MYQNMYKCETEYLDGMIEICSQEIAQEVARRQLQ